MCVEPQRRSAHANMLRYARSRPFLQANNCWQQAGALYESSAAARAVNTHWCPSGHTAMQVMHSTGSTVHANPGQPLHQPGSNTAAAPACSRAHPAFMAAWAFAVSLSQAHACGYSHSRAVPKGPQQAHKPQHQTTGTAYYAPKQGLFSPRRAPLTHDFICCKFWLPATPFQYSTAAKVAAFVMLCTPANLAQLMQPDGSFGGPLVAP